MSWSLSEIPSPSFNSALDRYLTEEPDEPRVVYECDMCGCEIYEGDDYYEIGDTKLCEDCMGDCKKTAEREDY